ncbi:hypothetical protein BSLG_009934 [Batrachochytrium salamandrivorans]|nr:hypothetical protein BSLG_009934 [Batrachochytrium salamandrivorans]
MRYYCWLPVLLFAAMASTRAAVVRPANKTFSTLTLAVIGDYNDPTMDNLALGVRMAADEINRNPAILPDATIVIVNVYPPPPSQLALLYDFLNFQCGNKPQYAVVGPGTTSTAVPLFLTCPNAPGFSVGAAGDILSDKTLYPLFFRYATSWGTKLYAQISYFQYFGWTRIALISSTYSVYQTAARLYISTYTNFGIEISASVQLPDPPETGHYFPIIKPTFDFLASANLRIFNVLAGADQVADCLMAANITGLLGSNYVWTTPQAAVDASAVPSRWGQMMDPSLLRSVTVLAQFTGPIPSNPYYRSFVPRCVNYINSVLSDPVQSALYSGLNTTTTDPNNMGFAPLYFYQDYQGTIPTFVVSIGYDGMYAIAEAWEQGITAAGSTSRSLADGTIKSQITLQNILQNAQANTTLMSAQFEATGDFRPFAFALQQYSGSSYFPENIVAYFRQPNASDICSSPFMRFGNRNGNRTFDDYPIAFIPSNEVYVGWNAPGTISLIVTAMCTSAYCIVLAIALLKYRKTPYVKSSSPFLLLVTAFGLSLMSLNVFTLIGTYRPISCKLRAFPTSLGLAIVLASMFVKCLRLFVIFCRPIALGPYSTILTRDSTLFAIMGAIISVMLTILVSFSFGAPFQSLQVYIDSSDTYVWACANTSPATTIGMSLIGCFLVILIIAVGVLAFYIRAIPDLFNNVKETINSLYIIVILGIVALFQGVMSYALILTEFYSENITIQFGVILVATILLGTPILRQLTTTAIFKLKLTTKTTRSRLSYLGSGRTTNDAKLEVGSVASGGMLLRNQMEAKMHKLEKINGNSKNYISIVTIKTNVSQEDTRNSKSTCQAILKNKSAVTMIGTNLKQWRRIRIVLFLDPAYIVMCSFRTDPSQVFYCGFLNITTVKAIKDTNYGFQNVIELNFENHLIVIPFEDEAQMKLWTNSICRTILAHEDPRQLKNLAANEHIYELEVERIEDKKTKDNPVAMNTNILKRTKTNSVVASSSKKKHGSQSPNLAGSQKSGVQLVSSTDSLPIVDARHTSSNPAINDVNRF